MDYSSLHGPAAWVPHDPKPLGSSTGGMEVGLEFRVKKQKGS